MKATNQESQMEWLNDMEQTRQRDMRRQQKHKDLVAWRETESATSTPKQNNPQNVPLTSHWFNSLTIPPPPGFIDTSKYTFILPRPTEPPKTPPSFKTASFQRRCMGSEPISPPNPLRTANTKNSYILPRPEALPRFLRAPFSPLDCERIGDPSLKVFKVKLPDYLIDGPLDALVTAAEQYAKLLPNGWKTNLYSLTKCDLPCPNIPGIESYLKPIQTYILLTMKMLYAQQKNASSINLAYSQPHIVKYSKDLGHTGVELHCDRCDFTANLSLSSRKSYRGGGTYISALQKLIMLEKGEILFHPGNLVHGGNAITKGTRYLLVAFANTEK